MEPTPEEVADYIRDYETRLRDARRAVYFVPTDPADETNCEACQ